MLGKRDIDFIDEDIYEGDEDEDTMKDKYLTFHLGKEVYGIEIYHVIEIIGIHRITEVPDMPDYVKGVINLRGQVMPVMDVRIRFHMEPLEYNDRTCIIIIMVNDTTIGLVVDTVEEVIDIMEENISPPPKVGKGVKSRYIKGMGRYDDRVKIILDADKLLFEDIALISDSLSEG